MNPDDEFLAQYRRHFGDPEHTKRLLKDREYVHVIADQLHNPERLKRVLENAGSPEEIARRRDWMEREIKRDQFMTDLRASVGSWGRSIRDVLIWTVGVTTTWVAFQDQIKAFWAWVTSSGGAS